MDLQQKEVSIQVPLLTQPSRAGSCDTNADEMKSPASPDSLPTERLLPPTVEACHGVITSLLDHRNPHDSIIFANLDRRGPLTPTSTHESTSTGHGRIEVRRCRVYEAVDRLHNADA